MRIAVVICTYNRAATLRDTLACMAGLPRPQGCDLTFIVVNNCCTDETDSVATSFADRMPLQLTHESQPGLSNARNRGLVEARQWEADLVIWTDDDIRPYDDWLVSYAKGAQAHSQAAVLGGPIEALFQTRPPKWITDNWASLGHAYGRCELGDTEVPLNPQGGLPFGGNFAIRVAVLGAAPFNPKLGVVGGKRLAGEETVLMRSLLEQGHGGWWLPLARVRHLVEPERLTLKFVARYFFGAGVSEAIISPPEGVRLLGRPRWLLSKVALETSRLLASLPAWRSSRWTQPFIRLVFALGQLSRPTSDSGT